MKAQKILTTKDISLPFLSMLRFCGCHPKEKGIMGQFIFWIFVITGIIYSISAAIKCFQQVTLESFAVTYIDQLVASQTTIKVVAFNIYRNQLSKLLDTFWNEFWPLDKIKNLTNTYNKSSRIVLRCEKIYRFILICCIIQISLFSLTFPIRRLPYNFYFFGYEYNLFLTTPYYEILYAFECITLSVSYVLCLIPFDMIYIALCGCTIIQFDILKEKFLQIVNESNDKDASYDNIKEAIIHHNMLLEFIKDLEAIVTYPILKQYIDAISCMGIYIYLSQQNFHFLYVFSLMTNLSQTLFFSYFGQMIQDRSLAIAKAVYESNWHLFNNRKLREAIVLVIIRAQRKTRISAGGFIFLSFESFLGMVKAAGSFLAVLRSTKD